MRQGQRQPQGQRLRADADAHARPDPPADTQPDPQPDPGTHPGPDAGPDTQSNADSHTDARCDANADAAPVAVAYGNATCRPDPRTDDADAGATHTQPDQSTGDPGSTGAGARRADHRSFERWEPAPGSGYRSPGDGPGQRPGDRRERAF